MSLKNSVSETSKAAVSPIEQFDTLQPAISLPGVLLLLTAAFGGALLAVLVLPLWMPSLSSSLSGTQPKAFWYLSRSSAFVAFGLLWFSMALGLSMTNKLARIWPGGPTAFDLHQYTSLLGLAFATFHGLILLGDQYTGYTLAQLAVPFASANYRPLWVGLGQVGFYVMALVGLSFYARRTIGQRAWRLIHFLSFAMFVLALLHGMGSGTDSAILWAKLLYWGSGITLLAMFIYRLLVSGRKKTAPDTARSKAKAAMQATRR